MTSLNSISQTVNKVKKDASDLARPAVQTPADIYGGTKKVSGRPLDQLSGIKGALANGADLSPQLLGAQMPDYHGIMTMVNGKLQVLDPYRIDPGMVDKVTAQQNHVVDQNMNHSLDNLAGQASQAQATGMSDLANSGGFDAGAAARMAQSGMAQRITGGQDIYAAADQARGNLGVQNAQGHLAAAQFNAGNAIGDNTNMNDYAMGGWGKLGDIYGSGQIADAMAKQAGKEDPGLLGMGGMLGTGLGGNNGLLGTGLMSKNGFFGGKGLNGGGMGVQGLGSGFNGNFGASVNGGGGVLGSMTGGGSSPALNF